MYYTNRAGECITLTGRVNVLNVNRAGGCIECEPGGWMY